MIHWYTLPMNKSNKLVGISIWYLLLKLVITVAIFIGLFVFFWMASYMIGVADSLSGSLSSSIAGCITVVLFIGNILYWKNSGIYITKNKDHIVKLAGWFSKEDKLLNGVIIANQVTRNPLDQLFGTASIQTGLFGDRKLVGVKYKDLGKYDDAMRGDGNDTFSSIF